MSVACEGELVTASAPAASADGRFGLPAAPGGLRLTQSLVNTALAAPIRHPRPDLLAVLESARQWLSPALAAWSAATGNAVPVIDLDQADLPPLRDHRELLRAQLRATPGGSQADTRPDLGASRDIKAKVLLNVGADGRVGYEPLESGWRALRALTSAEALVAQASGTWSRLKACAYPPCGLCFYDTSPNRSRVWHDTATCGNITNLRASRSRRQG
jgi:predicted RNA-binding Zn ribbon-like protein